MKLFISPLSPYARKTMVLVHETGQLDDVEPLVVNSTPVDRHADLAKHNPLGKLPALVRDDGFCIFDSRAICQFLDDRHNGSRFYPTTGDERWKVLRLEALADGLLDAALLIRYEIAVRPKEFVWNDWVEGQTTKITAALDVLETEAGDLEGMHMGAVAVACALDYLNLRFSDLDWQSGRPNLSNWFHGFVTRPSMVATAPKP